MVTYFKHFKISHFDKVHIIMLLKAVRKNAIFTIIAQEHVLKCECKQVAPLKTVIYITKYSESQILAPRLVIPKAASKQLM